MRLIDADALMDTAEGVNWYHIDKMGYLANGANSQLHTPLFKAEDIFEAIRKAPTVEAVILPCKLGDPVFIIGGKCRAGRFEQWINTGKFRLTDLEKMGKTVFLTREEAEAALAKMG